MAETNVQPERAPPLKNLWVHPWSLCQEISVHNNNWRCPGKNMEYRPLVTCDQTQILHWNSKNLEENFDFDHKSFTPVLLGSYREPFNKLLLLHIISVKFI